MNDTLQQIRERCDKATKGPWKCTMVKWPEHEEEDVDIFFGLKIGTDAISHSDATFLSHARTDIPKLCAALEVAIEALKGYCSSIGPTAAEITLQEINKILGKEEQ